MFGRFSKWLDAPVFKNRGNAQVAIIFIQYAVMFLLLGSIAAAVFGNLGR